MEIDEDFNTKNNSQNNYEDNQDEYEAKILNSFQSNKENKYLKNKFENSLTNKKKAKGFRAFNLDEKIVEAINKIGYKFPTPIQRRTIPEIISGFNVIAHSRTGSGKTAAFMLPIINRLKEHSKVIGCRCLILSPTRELAHQTLSFCKKLGKFTDLRYTLLVGGNELEGQFEKLATNPDIIIATPGRVMHHLNEGSLNLKKIEILCVDEADKIFELNFEEQVKTILKNCSPSRQVLLFSATIPAQLAQFMKTGIREYKLINIDEENKIPDKLKIHLIHTRTEDKKIALVSLLTNSNMLKNNFTPGQKIEKNSEAVIDIRKQTTLIFVSTKYHCEFLHEFLKFWKINTLFIYGQMDQDLRDNNLESFRKKKVNTLIVTDVAARGLDIPLLDNVINYDFPDTTKLFIHRVGRTARAGRDGRCINIVSPQELPYFFDIKVNLGKRLLIHNNNSDVDSSLNDCEIISFGAIPPHVLSQVKENKIEYLNFKTDMEGLEDSSLKAYNKALTFRQKPSRYGIKQSKKLLTLETIQPHPLFIKLFSQDVIKDELEKANFLTSLKNFKPKESYFERINETNVKEEVIKDFKRKANEFKKKKEQEKRKDKLLRKKENEIDDDFLCDNDDEIDEQNLLDSEGNEIEKNKYIQVDYSEYKEILKKKEILQKKLEKLNIKKKLQGSEVLENQKEQKNKLLGKKIKRSQIKNFKNNPDFITEIKNSENSQSLWGDEKPLTLDELTLNITPDDDNLNPKKKMVWDPKKKNFIRGSLDKAGNVLKTNESGAMIKKGDKNPRAFKTWQKKNKLKVQKIGESENEQNVTGAQNMFIERKLAKQRKNNNKMFNNKNTGYASNNGSNNGGFNVPGNAGNKGKTEVKSFDQILKGKKDQFKHNSRNFSKKDSKLRQMKEKAHLNRRSQVMVKRKGSKKDKRDGGKRKRK